MQVITTLGPAGAGGSRPQAYVTAVISQEYAAICLASLPRWISPLLLPPVVKPFPLVIGEAMACGTSCVVTDVGDSALIVDETGRVGAPGDPDALAEAWRKLIEAGPGVRRRLGMAARRRVQQHFALPAIVERDQAIYAQLAARTLQGVPSPIPSQCARDPPLWFEGLDYGSPFIGDSEC